ncbi:hypothetical protein GQ464_004320 [Rhodocaloribacter litoris]|uniref:sulfotransferase family 2 domain-containing protein n=1 Tax=Rhodocaloribacter litoris TaxID=2558931 RepID=UPI001421DC83|nr:sulfotransferase family 2 domain-containing protein [Rhodocaloribacter litoris]QXD16185.1 hypothetical protein GQ464_004320 [Rhodocaloribacter litoris]
MAILCRNLNLLYVQVPATGCSVVGQILKKQFDGEDVGRKHDDVPRLLASGVLSSSEVERLLVVANVRNPFDRLVTYYQRLNGVWIDEYFAFRRRDLERRRQREGLSEADVEREQQRIEREEKRKRRRVRIIRGIGFNTWVVWAVLRRRLGDRKPVHSDGPRFLNHLFPMLEKVNVVLRQEQLEVGLNAVLQHQGVTGPVHLPRKNLTPGKRAYTEYYNTFSRRLIEHLYAAELEYMGYTFDGCRITMPMRWLGSAGTGSGVAAPVPGRES